MLMVLPVGASVLLFLVSTMSFLLAVHVILANRNGLVICHVSNHIRRLVSDSTPTVCMIVSLGNVGALLNCGICSGDGHVSSDTVLSGI